MEISTSKRTALFKIGEKSAIILSSELPHSSGDGEFSERFNSFYSLIFDELKSSAESYASALASSLATQIVRLVRISVNWEMMPPCEEKTKKYSEKQGLSCKMLRIRRRMIVPDAIGCEHVCSSVDSFDSESGCLLS